MLSSYDLPGRISCHSVSANSISANITLSFFFFTSVDDMMMMLCVIFQATQSLHDCEKFYGAMNGTDINGTVTDLVAKNCHDLTYWLSEVCSVFFLTHNLNFQKYIKKLVLHYIIWAGKMNRILRCDWLPKWSYHACLGLPTVSHKKIFPESQIRNLIYMYWPSLFGQDDWILALFFFCELMDLDFILVHKLAKKKRTWSISSYLDLTHGQ